MRSAPLVGFPMADRRSLYSQRIDVAYIAVTVHLPMELKAAVDVPSIRRFHTCADKLFFSSCQWFTYRSSTTVRKLKWYCYD